MAVLICLEINLLLRLEQLKKDLEKLPNFNLRHCFKAIDDLRNKYLDQAALKRFFIKVGHKPVKDEIKNIMRRVDLDGDNHISFTEFCEALVPITIGISVHPGRQKLQQ